MKSRQQLGLENNHLEMFTENQVETHTPRHFENSKSHLIVNIFLSKL